jgi:hypothetical protein
MSKRAPKAEVINLADYHRESTPFDKPSGKARVLSFRRKGEPRFQEGDIVTPAYMKGGKWARIGDVKASDNGWLVRLSETHIFLPEKSFRLVERGKGKVFKVGDYVRSYDDTTSVRVMAVDVDEEGDCALSFDEGREPMFDATYFVLTKPKRARKRHTR